MAPSKRWVSGLVFLGCLSLAACNDGSSSSSTGAASQTDSAGSGSGTVTGRGTITTSTTGSGTSSATGAAAGYAISGAVSGITGVSVVLKGAAASSTTTNSSGNFSFAGLGAGNYTVSPAMTGYVFTPVSRAATLTAAASTGLTFSGTANTAPTYSISGTVSGSAAAGVMMTLNGTNIGSATTDLGGNYTFSGLVSGTYTVSASLRGASLSRPLIVSLNNTDSGGNNFTSTAAPGGGNVTFTAVTSLPTATAGRPYSASVVKAIAGGTGPYRYDSGTLASGTPPLGMIINPNGDLTGNSNTAGQYGFSVCAFDAAGAAASCQATSITVVAAQPSPTPAPTVTLDADPATVTAGGSSILSWSSKNSTSCTASGGWTGTKADAGTFAITPSTSTDYILTCTGPNGSDHASVLIAVEAASPTPVAPTVSLTASETTIPAGSSSTLKWSSEHASSCVGSGGWTGTETTSGTRKVSPARTTTFTLACTSSAGTAQTSAKITVDADAPPPTPTVTLTASPTSIHSGGASTLTWSSTNADSCTASDAWSGAEAVGGSQTVSPSSTATYTLSCEGSGGTVKASATIAVNAPKGPPPSGTSWVYYDGKFDWPGDYSFVAKPDYTDTSGNPLSGAYDVKLTLEGSYGGWLPYAQNWDFNSAGYTKLTFALKPTVANQRWNVYFVKVGDVPVGIYLNVLNYGPAPVVGQWNTYTVPLSDLGVLGTSIYKFCIQDQTGLSNNVWYVDNVGFAP